ncbi:hypothetical protein Hanom_Chr14g01329841 [Helianthus anomalus]
MNIKMRVDLKRKTHVEAFMLCSRDPLNRGRGGKIGFFLPDNSLSNLERHGGERRDGDGFLTREHTLIVILFIGSYLFTSFDAHTTFQCTTFKILNLFKNSAKSDMIQIANFQNLNI